MKNAGQQNPVFRNYAEVIAASENKNYQKASKDSAKDGIARRKVEILLEQRQLEKELAVLGC